MTTLPKCPKHPKYKAKRPPKTCGVCWDIFKLKQLADNVDVAVEKLYIAAYEFFVRYPELNIMLEARTQVVSVAPRNLPRQTAEPIDFDDYPHVKVKDKKAVLLLHNDLCVGYPAGDHHGACSLWHPRKGWQNP